jgi:hypothetical protein
MKRKSIGELLLEYRKISEEDLAEALQAQKKFKLRLGETLIKLGKVAVEDIEWILSKQLNIPFVMVENVTVERKLLSRFTKEFLVDNSILPLYETEDNIAIATDDPLNEEAFGMIEKTTGKNIMLSSGNREKITDVLKKSFHTECTPRLGGVLEQLIERLRGTAFYRIDFIVGEHDCEITVFGSGIRRQAAHIMNTVRKEDVFETLESMDIGSLYDEYVNDSTVFLSVYPLFNNLENPEYPVVAGMFGLYIPHGITFADIPARGLPRFFYSPEPVKGYPFLSLKNNQGTYGHAILTPDSVLAGMDKYSVHAVIPEQCFRCHGAGCDRCRHLGYVFEETIEGACTGKEIKQLLLKD